MVNRDNGDWSTVSAVLTEERESVGKQLFESRKSAV